MHAPYPLHASLAACGLFVVMVVMMMLTMLPCGRLVQEMIGGDVRLRWRRAMQTLYVRSRKNLLLEVRPQFAQRFVHGELIQVNSEARQKAPPCMKMQAFGILAKMCTVVHCARSRS